MIDFATQSDFEDISNVWQLSFGDSKEYVKFFWNGLVDTKNVIVYRESNRVVAMYFFLECNTIINGKKFKTYYLYAAATHPDFRKKGIMGKLINKGINIAKERGIEYIVLVPAEKYLYDYYSKFGFKTAFKKKVVITNRSELEQFIDNNYKIDKNLDVFKTREIQLANIPHIEWSEEFINYAFKEHSFTGGELELIDDGYILYREDNDKVVVKEMSSISDFRKIFDVLLDKTKSNNFELNLPMCHSFISDNCNVINEGMILNLNNNSIEFDNGYIGLTLG